MRQGNDQFFNVQVILERDINFILNFEFSLIFFFRCRVKKVEFLIEDNSFKEEEEEEESFRIYNVNIN